MARAQSRLDTASPITLVDFRDVPLGEVLRVLTEQTGINMVASSEAAQVKVSLYLRDVPPLVALDTLARAHNLWYRRDPQSGIIRLHTVVEFQRDVSTLREDLTEIFTLLYPNAVDVAVAITDLFGERVRLSLGADDSTTFNDLSERFDRFDLLDGRSQGLGIFQGGSGSSGSGIGTNTRNNRVRSSDRDRLSGSRRSDLLRDQRAQRTRQQDPRSPAPERLEGLTAEEIQAIIRAETDDETAEQATALRPATIFVTVIRKHNRLVIRTGDEPTMAQIRDLIRRLDVPTPLVLLEVKILSIELGDDFTSAFDLQFAGQNRDVAGSFSSGNIVPPALGSLVPGGTGLAAGNLLFQYVSDNFRIRLQLLESRNRVTTLATPLLLTANNEVSRLFVGEERPLNRGFTGPQTVVGIGGGVTTTPGSTTIEFRPIGTTLLITPNINADRTVTLRILQEVSSISPNPASVLVPTDTGFEQQLVDVVQARTVSGTVVAKDGLMVAIGGLIEENVADQRSAVPILGKIPVLGFFFRRQNIDRGRRELIMILRPYVFNTPTEAEGISQQLLNDLSLHPTAPEGKGTLGSHAPHEVARPQLPQSHLQQLFRFHSVGPKEP